MNPDRYLPPNDYMGIAPATVRRAMSDIEKLLEDPNLDEDLRDSFKHAYYEWELVSGILQKTRENAIRKALKNTDAAADTAFRSEVRRKLTSLTMEEMDDILEEFSKESPTDPET